MDSNKLRDLLRKARLFIECSPLKKVENSFGCLDRDRICAEIDAALAEPVKNCEVGTAEEQAKRFHEFCFGVKCAECRAHFTPEHEAEAKLYGRAYCVTKWAQMPYNEGDDK